MNTGMALQALAQTLEAQRQSKRDFIIPAPDVSAVGFQTDSPRVALEFPFQGRPLQFGVGEVAHDQLADYTNIPAKYYDRMRTEAPALWAASINTWLGKAKLDDRKLVRVLDGRVRAWLSDRYRPLDNDMLAGAALPILTEAGADILSANVSEAHFHIKAVDPKLRAYIGGGGHHFRTPSEIIWGVAISNSEVGKGRVDVRTFYVVSVCSNAAIVESMLRKYHLGARLEADSGAELFTSEARAADNKAFALAFRDVVRGALTEARMTQTVEKINAAAGRQIEGRVQGAVEVASLIFDLQESESQGVLRHLINGGDLSQWGLANAITRQAGDLASYDRATELEAAGHQVIELPADRWHLIAEAA